VRGCDHPTCLVFADPTAVKGRQGDNETRAMSFIPVWCPANNFMKSSIMFFRFLWENYGPDVLKVINGTPH